MTATSFGPKKQPRFAAGDAPDLSGNPTEAAEYAAKFGNRTDGTTGERNLATSWAWEGLQFFDTTEKQLYGFTGGAWKLLPMHDRGYRAAATDATGKVAVVHTLGRVPVAVVVTGGMSGTIPERRTYAIASQNASQFVVQVYRQDTGQVLSGNPVDFHWLASL